MEPRPVYNRVEVQGKVVGIGKDHMGHDTITILVVRPKGRPSQRTAIAPTGDKEKSFVRFALKDPLEFEVRHNDHVRAEGFTNAYSYRDDSGDKWTYVQYFVADKFERQKTKLMDAFGVEGKFYDASYFKGFYRGEVMSVIRTKNSPFARLVVRTPETGQQRSSTLRFTYLTTGRLPDIKKFEKGDEVCVAAGINTPQREVDGKLRSMENLFVEDIAIIKKHEPQEEAAVITDDPALAD